MASKSVVMASSLTGEAFESFDVEFSDSDSWQVIDPSDSDDGNFSYGDVITDDDDDDEDNDEAVPDVDDLLQHPYGSPASDISMQSLVDEITHHCQELNDACEIDHIRQTIGGGDAVVDDGEDDSYDEAEDADDDSDLDDELVPKWLNNKFERQRMKKLGKRAYPKMKKSKRLAYMYNKPGCVHGKHGVGTKHNLIW
ncbi:hypothetical protein L1987_84846 [Smallanthus sonchifolius]|uniref:Uncharacterized protein n=1 Tax=Smallanthus sonchifolius TaxID=185202 RepID=A0ACB8XVI7_9ASTR|nr:hypothetical protein L1987_84846 [Smallanthus sonchifolius]